MLKKHEADECKGIVNFCKSNSRFSSYVKITLQRRFNSNVLVSVRKQASTATLAPM